MKQYLKDLRYILEEGETKSDRTGVGTVSVFGMQSKYDISYQFPAMTTKKLAWKSVVGELLWFLRGSTNVFELSEIIFNDPGKPNIWTANYNNQAKTLGYDNGYLGPIYGAQWRNYNSEGLDQLHWLIEEIKHNPDSRRLILTAWNPIQLKEMTLPPCHCFAQFNVINGYLDCMLYQRSGDMFLGVPFNIASYSLLTYIIAGITGLKPGIFIHTIGDAHIYTNHLDQVSEQLLREDRIKESPTLEINVNLEELYNTYGMSMFNVLEVDDFRLKNYDPLPAIKAPMAV